MNVFELLKEDHDKVKELFQDYEACGDHAFKQKQTIADEVFGSLEIHAKVEEEILYPAVKEEAGDEGKALIDEAFEEHRIVKKLIKELRELKAGDDQFEAKFKVLRENVEHHIQEEEDDLFSEAKKVLADDLDEISEEVEERSI